MIQESYHAAWAGAHNVGIIKLARMFEASDQPQQPRSSRDAELQQQRQQHHGVGGHAARSSSRRDERRRGIPPAP